MGDIPAGNAWDGIDFGVNCSSSNTVLLGLVGRGLRDECIVAGGGGKPQQKTQTCDPFGIAAAHVEHSPAVCEDYRNASTAYLL